MKNRILSLTVLLFILSFFVACQKKEKDFEQTVGFIHSKTGAFQKVNQNQVLKFWKKVFPEDKNVRFDEVRVVKGTYLDTHNDFYVLKTISRNKTVAILQRLDIDEKGRFLLVNQMLQLEGNDCDWEDGLPQYEKPQKKSSCRLGQKRFTYKKTVVDNLTEYFN